MDKTELLAIVNDAMPDGVSFDVANNEVVLLYSITENENGEDIGEIRLPRNVIQAMHRLTK